MGEPGPAWEGDVGTRTTTWLSLWLWALLCGWTLIALRAR